MKNTMENLVLLTQTEDQLYRLRNEITDSEEEESPINQLIDWIQDKKKEMGNK